MRDYLLHTVTLFMGFFAVANPIANTPLFLGLTANDSDDVRRAVAGRAVLVAFLIIAVFAISGRLIFEMFGIGLPAFRITGGLLVLHIGFLMLQGRSSGAQHLEQANRTTDIEGELDKAISPLAMPILAGPGAIATAINFSSGRRLGEAVTTVIAFFLLCVVTYYFFIYGERMVRYLGNRGMGIVTRLMGLILAVIGTQMIIDGVMDVFKPAA